VAACDGCRAPILWAVNDRTGNRHPVNATPDPAGNIALTADGNTYHVFSTEVLRMLDGEAPLITSREATAELAEWGNLPRYTSHFATCPASDVYRRRCPHCRQATCACPERSARLRNTAANRSRQRRTRP
jgi:hypothetical protein